MLGAVLLWDFMTRVMQGITTAFLEDVWSRNFLNLFASPLSGRAFTSVYRHAVRTGLIARYSAETVSWGIGSVGRRKPAPPYNEQACPPAPCVRIPYGIR